MLKETPVVRPVALSVAVLAGVSAAQAYTYMDLNNLGGLQLMSYDDPWNIIPKNQGNTIDGNSYVLSGFTIERIFGWQNSNYEDAKYNTIFNDGQPQGTVNFVNFHTNQSITLSGVNLFAAYDIIEREVYRAMSSFSLYYSNDGNTWNPIISGFVTYDPLNSTNRYTIPGSTWQAMAAGFTFDPVTASYFRAEFVQYGKGQWQGVRVCELDAVVVPLPAAVWLLGSGLLALAGTRRLGNK